MGERYFWATLVAQKKRPPSVVQAMRREAGRFFCATLFICRLNLYQVSEFYRLKDKCEEAWDQLAALDDIRQRLETDLEDKTEALKIDLEQLDLNERSAGLSHKPNPTRIPNGSVQPQAWHDFSVANKSQAEVELARSQKLREFIFHTIEQTSNDLRTQIDATNFDFRKRMYEMKRAKEEVEYQMQSVEYLSN